jgi:adenosine deaminase
MARTVQQIKKVELHQHVDGSIPLRTTWRLMKQPEPVNNFETLTVSI